MIFPYTNQWHNDNGKIYQIYVTISREKLCKKENISKAARVVVVVYVMNRARNITAWNIRNTRLNSLLALAGV